MNERFRKILVYSSLPLATAWAAYNVLDRAESPVPSAPTFEQSTGVPSAVATERPADLAKKAALPWGTDPFRCDQAIDGRPLREGGLAWQLSGIVYSNQFPLAFVNGRSVAVGDTILGAEVISIEPNAVTLNVNGERLQLRVNKG